MELEAGQRIGPYQILSVIGSGGMGTVYLAADRRLHRNVALKFIQPDPTADADPDAVVARLLNEARAASALNHPNVCQVYDVGGEGRESWIAMEYVEGRPLSELVRPAGLPMHDVLRLGVQIADGLSHAHSRGILHRDLKAANIVCDSAGRARILDFGIARRLPGEVSQELSTTAVPVDAGFAGTLAYMAPEVVRGETQDERSDLWSLGVVLYEMATGKRPFHGNNVIDVAAAIVRDPPSPLADDAPAPFASVVMRLLAKSPVDRYATGGEVAAALQPLSTNPVSDARRTGNSHWLMATTVVLAVVIAALGFFIWSRADGGLRITQQRLLSAADTSQRFPAYSADGSRIAFSAPDTTGVEQIWVRSIGSGDSIQLTRERVQATRPRWLSGDRLLYGVAGQGLWVVSALGGTPTRLIERGANPDVSRDGRRIVFETRAGGQATLWTAASDGSDVRQISGTAPLYYNLPMGPALSPDGSQVAYFQAAAGPNGDFWVIPSAGGTPRRLTSDLREGGWPVWTPDGNAIVFSSARAGSRTLWQVPVHGGEPTPLTTGAGEDDQPDVTADGRQLAYTNVRHAWELKTREPRERARSNAHPTESRNALSDLLTRRPAHHLLRSRRRGGGDFHHRCRRIGSAAAHGRPRAESPTTLGAKRAGRLLLPGAACPRPSTHSFARRPERGVSSSGTGSAERAVLRPDGTVHRVHPSATPRRTQVAAGTHRDSRSRHGSRSHMARTSHSPDRLVAHRRFDHRLATSPDGGTFRSSRSAGSRTEAAGRLPGGEDRNGPSPTIGSISRGRRGALSISSGRSRPTAATSGHRRPRYVFGTR